MESLASSALPDSNQNSNLANCNSTVPATTLSGTCIGLAAIEKDNLKLYQPQYPLYSEGASKRRWIYLPPGTKIDSTNPDEWVFPLGTILWKEFSVGNLKIETRQLRKIKEGFGPESWEFSVYIWRSDQSDAELFNVTTDNMNMVPARFAISQVSTTYSLIPNAACLTCHRGTKDVALGFNYLQLSDPNKNTWLKGRDSLWLTTLWLRADSIAGSALDQDTIGYLQSNCATCHNPRGAAANSGNFQHLSTATTLADENIIKTAGMRAGLIVNGDPDNSNLYQRVFSGSMPSKTLLPYKTPDPAAPGKIRSWIFSL